jgi:hypothetical protein
VSRWRKSLEKPDEYREHLRRRGLAVPGAKRYISPADL